MSDHQFSYTLKEYPTAAADVLDLDGCEVLLGALGVGLHGLVSCRHNSRGAAHGQKAYLMLHKLISFMVSSIFKHATSVSIYQSLIELS